MKAYQSDALKAILGNSRARSELRSLIQSGAGGALRAEDQNCLVVGADPRRTGNGVVVGNAGSPVYLAVEGHVSAAAGGTARNLERQVPDSSAKRFHIRVTPVK